MELTDPFPDKLILVVDDDPAICELLADGLASFGYRACTAPGVDEAMGIVRGEAIGMVLTDIEMPGADGFELLKRVKAHEPDIDVVMITGDTDAVTSIRAIREGASDYVTKPLNLEEVQFAIRRTFEERRLILENRAQWLRE